MTPEARGKTEPAGAQLVPRVLRLAVGGATPYGRYSSGNRCFSTPSFGKSLNTMYG